MQTAVGYIRVSTEEQASEGVSLAAQRAKIEAWCTLNDCHLLDVHMDSGMSGGRSDNRPGLQDALEDVCNTKSVLVVYSLSRLARSTRDTIAIADKLDKAGCDMVSLSEKIDTTSASGKMIFRMMAVLAEFERDQVSERTKMAMAHKRARGENLGTVPYGYSCHDGVKLVINEWEQSGIQLMRDLRSKGFTLQAIGDELEKKGYKTRRGRPWSRMTISDIIERENKIAG